MNVVAISIACSIIGTAVAILGLLRYFKKDTQEEAACNTKLETKIDYISKGVDDIRLDIKSQDRKISEITERLIRTEESTKSAHHRIDEIIKEGE